jgi:hypothetical protein
MLSPDERLKRACSGVSRREMLKVGALGLSGATLPMLLNQSASAKETPDPSRDSSFGKAKNCIVLFLSGGAAHLDTFDPKPNAPVEIRGEFDTIATSLTGVRVSEHLPNLAKVLHKGALIRSVTHSSGGHADGGYKMFTGYKYDGTGAQANFMNREDHPHVGAALSQLSPGDGPMVPFVLVPRRLDAGSGRRAGQWGGRLGGKHDPLMTGGNPNDDNFKLNHLPLLASRPLSLYQRRKKLLDQVNGQVEYLQNNAIARSLKKNQQQALDVMSSDAVRKAVDLSTADKKLRERFGRNLFGQSVLLGRRLLDAGTRLVQINWQRTQGKKGFAWDSHRENFEALREDLIPPFDRAFHALITDLEESGQLDETLVVVAGEFGRTPRVNLSAAGRDHWAPCGSVMLFGGGIKGGQVYGSSDRIGAFPATDPVDPSDLTATIYHCLGLDPHTELLDQNDRPMWLSEGEPIADLI